MADEAEPLTIKSRKKDFRKDARQSHARAAEMV
jgi:hypothetical protein